MATPQDPGLIALDPLKAEFQRLIRKRVAYQLAGVRNFSSLDEQLERVKRRLGEHQVAMAEFGGRAGLARFHEMLGQWEREATGELALLARRPPRSKFARAFARAGI